MARFSKQQNRASRRKTRRLMERFDNDVRLRIFEKPCEVDEFVDGTRAIARESYQAQMGAGFAALPDDVWRQVLSLEARRKHLRCYWLVAGTRPIAYQMGTMYGDVYYFEATGYLPEYRNLSPGTVLLDYELRDLCEAGVRIGDWGFGDAGYKRTYGTTSVPEYVFNLYGRTARARYAAVMERSVQAMSNVASYCIKHAGWVSAIKRLWRRRMATRSTRGGQ